MDARRTWPAGILDGQGKPIWPPAPNPMVVAVQDALEWRYEVYNMKNIIGGILAIPMFILCIYWTYTG